MIARSRRLRKPISVVLMLAIMLSALCFGVPSKVANAANDFIISGDYYYIKNVNSGKYLTTEHYSSDVGTNIVQWGFTGQANQKWKITKITSGPHNGYYKFATALDNSKVIQMESAITQNGVLAKLGSNSSTDNRQCFSFQLLMNFASRIYTVSSNFIDVLTMNGAYVCSGAKLLQYQTTYNANNEEQVYGCNANDQWLLEPVNSIIPLYATEYAIRNYNKHLRTYPDMDYYNNGNGGNCANFVSQCLVNSGYHYNGNWKINKNNNNYLAPLNSTQLNDTWELSDPSPWISAPEFQDYWSPQRTNNTYNIYDIINNTNTGSSVDYLTGDVVQVLKQKPFGKEAVHTMIITSHDLNDKGNNILTYQSYNTLSKSLRNVCNYYATQSGQYYVRFYDFT